MVVANAIMFLLTALTPRLSYLLAFVPAAVLVRGVEPVEGEMAMREIADGRGKLLTNGPGKFCRAFDLTRHQSGLDLTGSTLYIVDCNRQPESISQSVRIGIKKGVDKPWRFYDPGSHYVSAK